MDNTEVLDQLSHKAQQSMSADGEYKTAIPGLFFYQYSQVNLRVPSVYDTCFCLTLQGKKRVKLTNYELIYGMSDYLVSSVDLPVIGETLDASPEYPYVGVKLVLDTAWLLELANEQTKNTQHTTSETLAIYKSRTSNSLLNAVQRLFELLDSPEDIPVLAPLVRKEIHYRLVQDMQSKPISRIIQRGSHMQRIAQAITSIRRHYDQPLDIHALTQAANMSQSSFYEHFKRVTNMSPLQYQKQIRLFEARHQLLTQKIDAASVGFAVGYESASQFSREYARMFGLPPIRDVNSQ